MDCNEVQDKLDAHLLGALHKNLSVEIEMHLKGCVVCRECLTETARSLKALYSLPGIEPKGGYAEKIMSRRKNRTPSFFILFTILLSLLLWVVWLLWEYRGKYPYQHILQFERAIWKYRIQNGGFPPRGGRELSELLLGDKAGGPYLPKKTYFTNSAGEILDCWGTPYVYRYPGIHLPFDIYSFGKNKQDDRGLEDDVGNWNIGKK